MDSLCSWARCGLGANFNSKASLVTACAAFFGVDLLEARADEPNFILGFMLYPVDASRVPLHGVAFCGISLSM